MFGILSAPLAVLNCECSQWSLTIHSLPLLRTCFDTCGGVQANATGRSAKSVREFLEKHYSPEAVQSRDDTVMLAIKALLEVVQSGSKSMELAVMERGEQLKVIEFD